MTIVIIPIAVLILIIMLKQIPFIGGKVQAALLIGAALCLLMGGEYDPAMWLEALITGADKIAWVICLTLVGSIYAESQKRIGTMETVLNACRARFGRSPKGLVCVIMFTLCLSGSLLGESVASAVVIGALIIGNLDELGMTPEQTTATIVMGCALGSIMPPISQASTMAAGLVGADPDAVLNWTYLTIGIIFVLCCIYVCTLFIKVKTIPEDLIPTKTASQILKENWPAMVPLAFLALAVIFRSGFKMDILVFIDPIVAPVKGIRVLSGLVYNITCLLYMTLILSLFYRPVRQQFGDICVQGFKNVVPTISVQACAAFLIGSFYIGGQIEATSAFLTTLTPATLIIGGLAAMCLLGMLTGSQTTTQTIVFTMIGPALIATGISPVSAAIAGGHWAMAGQGMPPADVVTFAVAGLVNGITGKKVDPIKAMLYACFMCGCMILAGLIFVCFVR